MGFNYEKAKQKHGDKYNYSKVVYIKAKLPVIIICPTHGDFPQTPDTHYKSGCSKCGKDRIQALKYIDKEVFFQICKEQHKDKNDYSKVIFQKLSEEVVIGCPTHGDFLQIAANHYSGRGCRKCGIISANESSKIPKKQQIKEFQEAHHNFYAYPNLNWEKVTDKIDIICPVHGLFKTQTAINHKKGHGCDKCGKEKANKNRRDTKEDFVRKAKESHPADDYDYTETIYIQQNKKVEIRCRKHGYFKQVAANHVNNKNGCPKCIKNSSRSEDLLVKFLSTLTTVEQSNRSILGRQELDIFFAGV